MKHTVTKLCLTIMLGLCAFSPALAAGAWSDDWFTCQTDAECVTLQEHPCHYIAINKNSQAKALREIGKEAPLIDCMREDLDKKQSTSVSKTYCDNSKRCAFETKNK